MVEEDAEELFRQVAAFASFGFAKSHAAAFARTAYESAFLKLFYPAQFLVGLINAQPMGFYPVEVLVNDTKRHGVAVLPVDINASAYRTTTEWVGPDGQPAAGRRRRAASSRSPRRASGGPRRRARAGASGSGCTWSRASASSTRRCSTPSGRAARTSAWPTSSSGPSCPRRSSSGSSGAARWTRWVGRAGSCCGSCARWPGRHAAGWTGGPSARWAGRPASAGRPPAGRWTCACRRPTCRRCRRSPSRSGSATPTRSSGSMPSGRSSSCSGRALDRLGAVTNASLPDRRPGRSGSAGWSSPGSTR